MIGAIAGDVIGSVYEHYSTKKKDFALFTEQSRFTDDTVLTIATAYHLLNQENTSYTDAYQKFGRKYPDAGYGGTFIHWIFSEKPAPYNSWGNGSAMRVSPVGCWHKNLDDVLAEAKKSAEVTHNHPEGIKGAQATASAIFFAKTGQSKEEIKRYLTQQFNYDLDRTLDMIRPHYSFDVSCQGSVPEAIIAFLESNNYEDAVRNAISLGGDSDTQACIAGGIAQAFYQEIPKLIVDETRTRLPQEFLNVIDEFEKS